MSRGGIDDLAADAILDDGQSVAVHASQLWAGRFGPFACAMAAAATGRLGPPVLHDHDPQLLTAAQRLLGRLHNELLRRGLDDDRWTYDHIGSIEVPGLQAERFIDLQLSRADASV